MKQVTHIIFVMMFLISASLIANKYINEGPSQSLAALVAIIGGLSVLYLVTFCNKNKPD